MTINSFSVEFLSAHAEEVFSAIQLQSTDAEMAAYYLKIIEHVLSNSGSAVPEVQILRWIAKFRIIDNIQKVYFNSIASTNFAEPVKGAILDFLATL